jgi:hypothetical protein
VPAFRLCNQNNNVVTSCSIEEGEWWNVHDRDWQPQSNCPLLPRIMRARGSELDSRRETASCSTTIRRCSKQFVSCNVGVQNLAVESVLLCVSLSFSRLASEAASSSRSQTFRGRTGTERLDYGRCSREMLDNQLRSCALFKQITRASGSTGRAGNGAASTMLINETEVQIQIVMQLKLEACSLPL